MFVCPYCTCFHLCLYSIRLADMYFKTCIQYVYAYAMIRIKLHFYLPYVSCTTNVLNPLPKWRKARHVLSILARTPKSWVHPWQPWKVCWGKRPETKPITIAAKTFIIYIYIYTFFLLFQHVMVYYIFSYYCSASYLFLISF